MIRRQADFPKELFLGENNWQIRFVRSLDGIKTLGLCDPADHIIYILQGQSPKERFKTFVHELLHALEYEYSFEMPHKSIYDLEEPLTRLWEDNVG